MFDRLRGLLLVLCISSVAGAQRAPAVPRDPMQEGLPLKPTRTMTFTTKVGNWMSVDVSPDGQTLVFDLLGDIYTMPIAGGKATALTRGMGFDAQPRFSPDGKKIVYVSDRDGGYNLYTLSLDKKDTVQLTTGKTNRYYSPVFTPDGKYVVATRGNRLFIYDIEGGTGEELARAAAAPAAGGRGGGAGAEALRQMGAAFGGDPRYVWFAQRRGTFMYNSPLQDYSLAVYDRESGETTTRETRWGSAFRPVLSPDGKWLVYGTRYINETRLRLRDLKTGEEQWLVYPVQRDDQESAASLDVLPGMAFTPDSKSLITTWDGKLWKVAVPSGKPVEIPFEADVVQPLGPAVHFDYTIPDSSTFVVKQIRDAVPSPDGRKLAFVALDHLYVMDYPSGTPKRLTTSNAGEFEPSWSPDGQWIAYSTWSGDGGQVYKVRADGGQPQKLTTVSSYWQHPTFSPTGARIVAIRGPARAFNLALAQGTPGGAEDIVWFPANGGDATFIAAAGGMDQPQFTRDTTRIFGYSAARGLVSMRWDGTDVRSLLKVVESGAGRGGGAAAGAAGVWISPDGSQALAQSSSLDLYTMSIPVVGGAAPTITLGETSAFPNKKLTDIGAQFPVWTADGKAIHWSIGNAHVVYDLERGRAFDDSVRRANRVGSAISGDSAAGAAAAAGRGGRGRAPMPQFRPTETRVRITAERDIPKSVSVLRGARVVTMKGNEVLENADIVVTNNRITAIGKRGSVSIPSGAHSIDVGGKTIIPGFVDTHAHLRVASNIHRDVQWSYAVNLAYGVTTARDPQTGATDVLSYEDEVRAGNVLGPRIYSTGPGVFSYYGIHDLESARRVLRRYSDYYDTKTIKEYETGNREVRQWVIQAANDLHLMPTTEGGLDYTMNMTEAIDGYSGHEHTIPTYPLQSDVIRLLVESGITYTPTLLVSYGGPWLENYWYEHEDLLNETKLRRFTPWNDLDAKIFRRGGSTNPAPNGAQAGWFADNQYAANIAGADIKHLIAAGGKAGIGSHGQLQGLGYHWELWSVAMGGMAPHDILRIATIIGARSLGLGNEVGSLEVGKEADLLVLDKNPLENIRNTKSIRYVMKNGRLYDANTLDEEWPRQRKAGTFYWQRDEGGTSIKAPAEGRAP